MPGGERKTQRSIPCRDALRSNNLSTANTVPIGAARSSPHSRDIFVSLYMSGLICGP